MSSEYRSAVANTPVTPAAGQAAIYTRTVGGVTTFYVLKDDGTEVQIPALGELQLVNADETQNSATVPNADTAVKTYTLAVNKYARIIAEAEGYGSFVVTSTNQIISIKIKFAGVQVGQTMTLDAALGATSRIPFPVKASGAFTAGGLITVTISAPAADANTTVFLNSLRVYGVI